MKKIVGIIAAAALATSAFAEVTVGSWSRGAYVPVVTDGDGNVNNIEGANWDNKGEGYGVRTGLGFKASSENAGVVFDVFGSASGSGASLGVGDNAYVWVKPFDMLRVAFGKVDNNWGRTDVCFGNYDHAMRYINLPNGEGIGAWRDHQGTGVNVTLTPVEGLVIDYQAGFTKAGERTYQTLWRNADLMVGYKADFGFIRAIFAPQNPKTSMNFEKLESKDYEWATIGLGADITAIENLTITAGLTIPTDFHIGYTVTEESYAFDKWTATGAATKKVDETITISTPSVQFGVGAHYNLSPLTLHGFFIGKLNADDVESDGTAKLGAFGFAIAAGVDFDINDQLSVITDFRFMNNKFNAATIDMTNGATWGEASWGAYAGLCQKLTNASFDFGVMLANQYNTAGAVKDGVTFAIPLMITTSF